VRNDTGDVDEEKLAALLQKLLAAECDDMAIPVYIRTQNSGALFRKIDGMVQIELWEVHPNNAVVVKTIGRLTRSFPSSTIHVPREVFKNGNLTENLAHTIATMSHQEVPGMRPVVTKSGNQYGEERDTMKPDAVTDLLYHILQACGQPKESQCITKHTREEVLYDNAALPFRRSGLYLLMRVVLQLLLTDPIAMSSLYRRLWYSVFPKFTD
jgi:hypothetical protein